LYNVSIVTEKFIVQHIEGNLTMSSGETTVYHEMAKLLGDELAADPTLVASVTLSAEKLGDTATIERLRLLSDLREPLGATTQAYAVGLLMQLPKCDGNWRETLEERELSTLIKDLEYVKPAVVEEKSFRPAKDLWKEEVDRLALAPDYVKLIYMASLVTRILKRDWHNFLQQQQLIDRAKLAAVVLGEYSDEIAPWVRLLDSASKGSYKGKVPKQGALSYSLS
tara:strand:- start:22246 stop:22917 length:672 start_codon:yes stop_codon:yes gene_type:complete